MADSTRPRIIKCPKCGSALDVETGDGARRGEAPGNVTCTNETCDYSDPPPGQSSPRSGG